MFSNNIELVDKDIKKDIEDRLWMENYVEQYIKEQYNSFMKGFYDKLSKITKDNQIKS